jgi:hypothetical protein
LLYNICYVFEKKIKKLNIPLNVLNVMLICRRSLLLGLHCFDYDDVVVLEEPVVGAALC